MLPNTAQTVLCLSRVILDFELLVITIELNAIDIVSCQVTTLVEL